LIFDKNAGGNVEASLDFAADGLIIFGPQGRKLQHWPYAEIMHAFPARERREPFLAHPSRPEIHLEVRDGAVYDAIRERASQLRPWRRGWKGLGMIMEGLPHEAQLGVWLLFALVAFGIVGFLTGLFG
jgi:hypothetical protein